MIAEQVVRIDVHKDRLIVRLKWAGAEEESHSTDGQLLSIPWQKPPSRKSRQILIPLGVPRNEVRPTRIERRARLVGVISRGRRGLTRSSQARPLTSSRSPHATNAVCVRSI
jgi:hypothetical protein